MGRNLVVFTTILFLSALVQCCLAAGDSLPSEDPATACLTVVIANKLLYNITGHASSNPSESVVRGWIDRLNEVFKCCLTYSQRLSSILVNRANRLRLKLKNQGGRKRQEILSQDWTLVVPAEGESYNEVEKLQKQVKSLQGVVKASSRVLKEIQETPSRTRKRTAKHYSKRQEYRIKKQRVDGCAASLAWLEDEGVSPVSVTVVNNETMELQTLTLNKDFERALNLEGEQLSEEDTHLVSMMLYVKDCYNVSGSAYHEMASLCATMPRHYRLKEKIAELNKLWNISSTPEGTVGVQQSLKERLVMCLERLNDSSSSDAPFVRDKKVKVKLTGDGTNIGKHLHVVNFVFTILDEGEKACTASGNHCIAILKESESYDAMKLGLKDIIREVESIEQIIVRDLDFDVLFYLGGDWKFLAMATGIDAATSTHACIWCKCPAIERHDSEQVWSISDVSLGAWTIEENVTIGSSRSKRYNVSHPPLFPTIPLTRVVVDNLHMFLRVAVTLIDLLLLELRRLDKIDKCSKLSKSVDQLQYIKKYESTLLMLGISGFSFWIGKESKKLKWRTLTGPEKLKLFAKLNIPETYPEVPDCSSVQDLWRELLDINQLLSVRPEDLTLEKITEFESRSKAFVRLFTDIYPAKHVTPYMHCMMQHVGQFMTVSGALLPFTQQGLEKYNDTMTKDYFRSTSHRGQECLKQMLQKQNRMEHLEHSGARNFKSNVATVVVRGTTDLHALRHAVHVDSYPTVGILSTRRIKRFQDVSDN